MIDHMIEAHSVPLYKAGFYFSPIFFQKQEPIIDSMVSFFGKNLHDDNVAEDRVAYEHDFYNNNQNIEGNVDPVQWSGAPPWLKRVSVRVLSQRCSLFQSDPPTLSNNRHLIEEWTMEEKESSDTRTKKPRIEFENLLPLIEFVVPGGDIFQTLGKGKVHYLFLYLFMYTNGQVFVDAEIFGD
ncbi:hypothetical protein HanPSC8_Chr17g0747651 [Helianthus annuus]|nr:hypothetical protein HanPSC8_Chr17g0747651 [Helianthus annuus]